MSIIVTILLNAVALFAAAYLLRPNVEVKGFVRAIIVGVVLAILNGTLGAILDAVALPLNFITLGLFSFIIDAIIILIADYFLKGFKVKGFWWAVVLAVLMAIFNSVMHMIF
jgi:putative membrane protein